MRFDARGKTALVTGAGGGIGRAIAVRFAQEGMNLALCGREEAKLVETARRVEEAGGRACVLAGDLLDAAWREAAVLGAVRAFGGVDAVVNNAGVALSVPFEQVTEAAFDQVMNTNMRVPYFLTQAAMRYLRASACPTVINIGSVVSTKGYPLQSAYTASKHALLGFSKALAKELMQDGVRVHVICPGGVYTDMIRVARPDLSDEGLIAAEDIADIAAFLLTRRSNAVIDQIDVHRVGKEPFA